MDIITLVDTPELEVVFNNKINKYMIHIKDHSKVIVNTDDSFTSPLIEPVKTPFIAENILTEDDVIIFENGVGGLAAKMSTDSIGVQFEIENCILDKDCEECRKQLINFIAKLGKSTTTG